MMSRILHSTNKPTIEIIPGKGFGHILLGMSLTEARKMSEEHSQWASWMGGNLNNSVVYDGVVAHCSENVIDQIHVRGREDAILFGMPITSLTREVLTTVCEKGMIDIEWEDRDSATLSGLWVWFDRFGPDEQGPEIVILTHGEEK